jgi:hypothetical protein
LKTFKLLKVLKPKDQDRKWPGTQQIGFVRPISSLKLRDNKQARTMRDQLGVAATVEDIVRYKGQ